MSDETSEFDIAETISTLKESVSSYMLAGMWSYEFARGRATKKTVEDLKQALVALQAYTDKTVDEDYEDKRIWSIVHMVEYYTGELEVIGAQISALESLKGFQEETEILASLAVLKARDEVWSKQLEMHRIAIAAHIEKVKEREFTRARRELDEDIANAEAALQAKALEEAKPPEVVLSPVILDPNGDVVLEPEGKP